MRWLLNSKVKLLVRINTCTIEWQNNNKKSESHTFYAVARSTNTLSTGFFLLLSEFALAGECRTRNGITKKKKKTRKKATKNRAWVTWVQLNRMKTQIIIIWATHSENYTTRTAFRGKFVRTIANSFTIRLSDSDIGSYFNFCVLYFWASVVLRQFKLTRMENYMTLLEYAKQNACQMTIVIRVLSDEKIAIKIRLKYELRQMHGDLKGFTRLN